ncbi:DNA primase family protein [Streptomyces sp. WC2508]|uniref:DNA primase family protein n=1 Tax=Streptomyces sp. WC2508 TaxID=3461405 RepID=UPI0040443565
MGVACGDAGPVVIAVHAASLPERNRLLPGITVTPSGALHGCHRLAALRGAKYPAHIVSTLRPPVLDCTVMAEEANGSATFGRAAHTAGGLATTGRPAAQDAEAALVAAAVHMRARQHIIQAGIACGQPPSARSGRPQVNHTPSLDDGPFDPQKVVRQILLGSDSPVSTVPAQAAKRAVPTAMRATGHGLLPDTLSDRGNAKLFVALYGRSFRHVPGLGWYRWSGYRWEIDEADTVLWTAGEMAERLAETDPHGWHGEAELRRHRRRALTTSGMMAMLIQAKAAPGMTLNAALLNADPYALCTPEGVVDLHTGLVAAPDPERHCHSHATSVQARPMGTPRWQQFLTDTFGDDAEGRQMIDFLHELLGYSITGDVGAQIMPFLYGQGKSGKSVFLDVIVRLLGDYADAAPPSLLMARSGVVHATDLAELHGRRIVVCSEPKPGDGLDESRVKMLTGGNRIKARRMRQDFFSFTPTHTLWLLGNQRPEVSTGCAFWRRMRLIPFDRVVADDRKIDNLADALVTEEGPGILHWLVTGARRYLNGPRDLTGPPRVRIATHTYAKTEDHTGRFLSKCCTVDPALRAEQTQLYTSYRNWCQLEGANPASSRAFAARVRETVGITTPKEILLSNQRKFYPGIALSPEPEEKA